MPVDGSSLIQSAACPTTRLCVVGDNQGNLISSTRPAGGSWRLAHVEPYGINISAISCPDAGLCVATAGSDVITSTSPAGPASGWHIAAADPGAVITSMECPATTLCVGFDSNGAAVTSTSPAARS